MSDKMGIMDVKAVIDKNVQCDIEVQVVSQDDIENFIQIHIFLPAMVFNILFSAAHGKKNRIRLFIDPMLQHIQCLRYRMIVCDGTILHQSQRPEICDLHYTSAFIFLCQKNSGHTSKRMHRSRHDHVRLSELSCMCKKANCIIKEI